MADCVRCGNCPSTGLLEVSLYGVRLIAPEETKHSCCSHLPANSTERSSERSGLIQGLRGEPPFDGTRFPRLPWGGSAVAFEDIDFIADWIDDGCAATDKNVEPDAAPQKPLTITLARVTEPIAEPEQFTVHEGGANEYMFERGELKQRMNLDGFKGWHRPYSWSEGQGPKSRRVSIPDSR
jgi:tyrosinase